MYIKVAICDDENNILTKLQKSIIEEGKVKGLEIEGVLYHDGRSLLADIENGVTYDAIFLDIKMPDIDGITVGEILLGKKRVQRIIFITSANNLMLKSYAAHPIYYIYKPELEAELPVAMDLLRKDLLRRSTFIDVIDEGKQKETISTDYVMYIEGSRNYVYLAMVDGERKYTRMTMEVITQQLNSYGFFRCQRGYAVNFSYIKCRKNDCFELKNGEKIPIGEVKQKAAKEWYYSMIAKNN